MDLAPLASPCLDAATQRDELMIYKGDSVHALSFVGGNAVFQVRLAFGNVGLIGTHAICRDPADVHLFVGSDGDVYRSDGVQLASVLDGGAQRTFYDQLSAANNRIFAGASLNREKLGLLMVPTGDGTVPDLAVLFDFASGAVGFREVPEVLCAGQGRALLSVGDRNTWNGDPASWNSDSTAWSDQAQAASVDDVIAGSLAGDAWLLSGGGEAFASGPIGAELSKAGLAFGDPQVRKLISRVWPKVRGREGDQLMFRVGGQEISGGPVSWGPVMPFAIGQVEPLACFVSGRLISLQVLSQGGEQWQLGSMDVEWRAQGRW